MSYTKFVESYITAILWSELDHDGNPLEDNFDESDFAAESLAEMTGDCSKFYDDNKHLFSLGDEHAGHDFWLTRAGHGTGFWDRGMATGEYLSEQSHKFGELSVYVGDDNKLYFSK